MIYTILEWTGGIFITWFLIAIYAMCKIASEYDESLE